MEEQSKNAIEDGASKIARDANGNLPEAIGSEAKKIGQGHGLNLYHEKTINDKMAELATTGEFTEVYGNRALSTAGYNGTVRPDIIAKRADGTALAFEFGSPSQAIGKPGQAALVDKISDMQKNNSDIIFELIDWDSY